MFTLRNSTPTNLPDIAVCQMACFPASFATRLGEAYVQKTLEWFFQKPNRFMFHCEAEGKVVGYCGGFAPQFYGDGSSSGMLQYAFSEAIKGTLRKPWLLLHPDLYPYYPLLIKNLKRKLLKQKNVSQIPEDNTAITQVAGLVIIGVHPLYRGGQVFTSLMQEFEKQALLLHKHQLNLSVKSDNSRAINAYKKVGWQIRKEEAGSLKMYKLI